MKQKLEALENSVADIVDTISGIGDRMKKVEDELQGCREDIRKMKEMQSVDAMLKSQQQTINNLSQMCAVGGLGLVGALILLKISKHM